MEQFNQEHAAMSIDTWTNTIYALCELPLVNPRVWKTIFVSWRNVSMYVNTISNE